MRLFPSAAAEGADPGRELGWITSATRSNRLGKEIALGYVKRGANEVGTRLVAKNKVAQQPRSRWSSCHFARR